MLGNFAGFAQYFKFKKSIIDNTTFRLHYRTTFAILLICSFLSTFNQFIGNKIDCIVDGVPGGIMNTYCWIHGTFTIPAQLTGRLGVDHPHPGVGPSSNPNAPENINLIGINDDGSEIRHAWYQWVCMVLFIQAIFCYVPHYLWKAAEGGKLSLITQGLDATWMERPGDLDGKKDMLVKYFHRTLRTHNSYVFKFVFCEILNLVNILAQIYLMDVFLGGQFTKYGTDVISVSELPIEQRVDPMNKVFPKVTKCTFHKYGPSGTVENKDGLCVLANNIINEKIYIFLWFWFITIAVWTAIHLTLRVVTLTSVYSRTMLLCNRAKTNDKLDISSIVKKGYYGDWFLLMQLSKHVNPVVYHEFLLDLRDKLETTKNANMD